MKSKLSALNGIRAIATIAIFLFHSGFLPKGTFPVTLFFMLSGFLMFYTKSETIKWNTGLKAMRKFYPLHVTTFGLALIVGRIWINYKGFETVKSAVLNFFLLQSWSNKYCFDFNGLAWYLSVTLFLYLISYLLVKSVNKITKPIFFIVAVICVIAIFNIVFYENTNELYHNPLYRVLDYLLGMGLAKAYLKRDSYFKSFSKFTFAEAIIVAVFCLQYFILMIIDLKITPGYFSFVFSFALLFFAIGKGSISKILSCKAFEVISKYSFTFYMIHELALRIFRKVYINMDENFFRTFLISISGLILSILFVILYHEMLDLIKNRKLKNNSKKILLSEKNT